MQSLLRAAAICPLGGRSLPQGLSEFGPNFSEGLIKKPFLRVTYENLLTWESGQQLLLMISIL